MSSGHSSCFALFVWFDRPHPVTTRATVTDDDGRLAPGTDHATVTLSIDITTATKSVTAPSKRPKPDVLHAKSDEHGTSWAATIHLRTLPRSYLAGYRATH